MKSVTAYGSESARDFPDYIEKASTKSLGRALLALGYGAAFAPEMDEGERIVDAPIERRATPRPERATVKRPAAGSARRRRSPPRRHARRQTPRRHQRDASDRSAARQHP